MKTTKKNLVILFFIAILSITPIFSQVPKTFASTVSGPDLLPVSLESPSTASINEFIAVTWTVTNQGDQTVFGSGGTKYVDQWVDNVWFSQDQVIDSSDTLVASYARVYLPLAPGDSYQPVSTVQQYDPPHFFFRIGAMEPGTYYLILDVDSPASSYYSTWYGNTLETLEDNNIIVNPIIIKQSDLDPVSFISPSSVSINERFAVTWTVTNQGDGTVFGTGAPRYVDSWTDNVWFSTDDKIDRTTDIALISYARVNSPLAPGQSYTPIGPYNNEFLYTIFGANAPGNYYLILEIDSAVVDGSYGNVYESSEGNNIIANPITIEASDLAPVSFTTPNSAHAHDTVALSWTITNQGDGIAYGSGSPRYVDSWADNVWFSTDDKIDPATDISVMSYDKVNFALDAGQSYTGNTNFILGDTAPGTYYFILETDAGEGYAHIYEENEQNNIIINQITIGNPESDTSLTVKCTPESVNNDQPVTTISGTLIDMDSNIGISGKTITVSYFDRVQWVQIGSSVTQGDGSYVYQDWTVPNMTNGYYPIKASFAGDDSHTASEATTTGTSGGGGLFVVPEYIIGGLAALGACFAGLFIYKKRSSLPIFT